VLPASTLLLVAGFSRPEFKVEIEVMAARVQEDAASRFADPHPAGPDPRADIGLRPDQRAL